MGSAGCESWRQNVRRSATKCRDPAGAGQSYSDAGDGHAMSSKRILPHHPWPSAGRITSLIDKTAAIASSFKVIDGGA